MSLITPSTKDINDTLIAGLEARLNQNIPLLPKSFLRVFAKIESAIYILLFKYIGFMFQQLFVQTASTQITTVNGVEIIPLVFIGRLIGIGDPVPATNAQLTIDITVNVQTGSIASGTPLLNSNNGVTYLTLGSVLLDDDIVSVNVQAASDQAQGNGAGSIGNLDDGSILTFANPLANIDRNAVVIDTVVTGADAEDFEIYRARVLARFQKRPQGGALVDFERWAIEPAGILNAYPYTSDCPGQVDVFIEATIESSGNPDGIPTNAQLEEALASIQLNSNGLATREPANSLGNTFPIERIVFDVVVAGLDVANIGDIQESIQLAVDEYFLERAPFIHGVTINPRMDTITQTALGGVIDNIVSANNGIFTNTVLSQSGTPTIVYILGIGEKAKVNAITFL